MNQQNTSFKFCLKANDSGGDGVEMPNISSPLLSWYLFYRRRKAERQSQSRRCLTSEERKIGQNDAKYFPGALTILPAFRFAVSAVSNIVRPCECQIKIL